MSDKYEIVCPRCLSLLNYVDIMSCLWSDESKSVPLQKIDEERNADMIELKKKVFFLLKQYETKYGECVKHRFFIQQTWCNGKRLTQNHLITTSALVESEALRLLNEEHPPPRKSNHLF